MRRADPANRHRGDDDDDDEALSSSSSSSSSSSYPTTGRRRTMTPSSSSSSSGVVVRMPTTLLLLLLLLATMPSRSRSLLAVGGGWSSSSSSSATTSSFPSSPPSFVVGPPRTTSCRSARSSSFSSSSSSSDDDHDGASRDNDLRRDLLTRSTTTTTTTTTATMVIVDAENVRGATSFRLGHAALLSRVRLWREDRSSSSSSSSSSTTMPLEPMIWVCDHGVRPSVHRFAGDRPHDDDDVARRMPRDLGVAFAGPGRTADDVIVDIVGLRCQHGVGPSEPDDDDDDRRRRRRGGGMVERNTTVVITADTKLISRCQSARRMGYSMSDVVFVEPSSLLLQLERYRTDAVAEEAFLGEEAGPTTTTTTTMQRRTSSQGDGGRADGKTDTMTSFGKSTIAMQQHAKFQARFQKLDQDATRKVNKNVFDSGMDNNEGKEEEEEEEDHDVDADVNGDDEDSQFSDDSSAASLAAQLKTEQIRRHLLLSDAYYLARPSKNVRGRRAHMTSAAVHAKYKDRNISKTQQRKMYARRFRDRRKEDAALAASKRKEQAARLQRILDRASGDYYFEDGDGAGRDARERNGPQAPSTTLLHTLLRDFERGTVLRSSGTLDDIVDDRPPTPPSPRDSTSVLGLDGTAGRVGSDDKRDPLDSTLKVPLRSDAKTNDSCPLPLRVVVISDTHGFEGALSRFVDMPDGDGPSAESRHSRIHGDDFLLPQADVLVHCGDFAASGSRKTQRAAARRLDDFMARQTHIPEKIVVQGNHDPDSPAKVLFPNSKALYIRSSSTLMVNGVSFALEPYSRRVAFRSIRGRISSSMPSLPECDILVSHEPPKGILDLTYHGFSAGSAYLRDLVEHAKLKPRLWLCGHIHESRGVTAKHFHLGHRSVDDRVDASTVVINASNANSGKANRLVSGAVVVEIDRRPSDTWSEERAENTLRSWSIDHSDHYLELGDCNDGLTRLGDDLELYTTRPGVRRRKGVPQSIRQQMKNARSTLLPSEK